MLDIPPDYVLSKLTINNPDAMVEIGAGTAFFSIAFYKALGPLKTYACDLSEVMIQWVSENVCPEYPGIIPVKTKEVSVPLDDAIADLVFMINLHHELEKPVLTVEESYRLLKPGGEIFIVDWKKQDMPEGPPQNIRCLPEQVSGQLEASGFGDVSAFSELPKHFLVVGKKY
ncbi:MAG: class I SAM-dependent methyltransferase [Pseudomonadota bacterium]